MFRELLPEENKRKMDNEQWQTVSARQTVTKDHKLDGLTNLFSHRSGG